MISGIFHNRDTIMENTSFNYLTIECNERGYKWIPELRLSFQNKDANGYTI